MQNKGKLILHPLTLLLSIVIVWVIYFVLVKGFFSTSDEMSAFGDSFGALDTLFSGLAFVGVIYAIIIQQKELKLQREELKIHREEFTINRLTNFIYQQINKVENTKNKFQYESIANHKIYSGDEAITALTNDLGFNHLNEFIIKHKDQVEAIEKTIVEKVENLVTIKSAFPSLITLLGDLSANAKLLNIVILNNKLDSQQRNELEFVYNSSLGDGLHNLIYALNLILNHLYPEREDYGFYNIASNLTLPMDISIEWIAKQLPKLGLYLDNIDLIRGNWSYAIKTIGFVKYIAKHKLREE